MSTTDIDPCRGTLVLENEKFALNSNSDVVIRVADDDALVALQAILAAVGGSVSVTRTIYNVALGPVNTEQSQVLPANTKGVLIKTRGRAPLKLAFSVGQSGTNYVSVPGRAVYSDDYMSGSLTVYFQSPQTSDVVEIVAYS